MQRLEFECVVQNLRRASRLITRRYEDALRPVNLTSSQYTILTALSGRDGIPHGMMADILGFEQTTLTRLIAPLKKRKLVQSTRNPKDKRERFISITPEGEALFAEAKIYWQREHDESLSRVETDEWQRMKQMLAELSR